MLVNTKPYGVIDIEERQKIFFPSGILGFENLHHYILFDATTPPFLWLQSLDISEIAFVLIQPEIFRPDYAVDIPIEDFEEIGLEQKEDLLTFAIVTIPEEPNAMTANLQGPILINRKRALGKQAISRQDKWKVKHRIMDELLAVRNQKAC